jgi:hypothetical protein
VNSVAGPLSVLSGSGNDTINVLDSAGFVTVNTGSEVSSGVAPFGDSIQINGDFAVVGDSPAMVLIDQDDTVLNLTVWQLGTLRVGAGAVLAKVGGNISLTGTIDLAGGALLHRTGGLFVDYRTPLIRGCNNGAWNGTSTSGAINSSLAAGSNIRDCVGYASGSQIAVTTIGSFSINSSDTLLRYTLEGDADLNATVNAADLGILSRNWQGTGKIFSQADFNYDSKVDVLDLYGLGVNFNQGVAIPATPISLLVSTAVPRRDATRAIELVAV